MNKYLKDQAERQAHEELEIFGFHIEHPRPKKQGQIGTLMNIDNENIELLELIEISDYKELWFCRCIDNQETIFIWI